ncbi:hypothetical protein EBU58_16305 [bacterium]|nr:hypothetical protein [bacterium]
MLDLLSLKHPLNEPAALLTGGIREEWAMDLDLAGLRERDANTHWDGSVAGGAKAKPISLTDNGANR